LIRVSNHESERTTLESDVRFTSNQFDIEDWVTKRVGRYCIQRLIESSQAIVVSKLRHKEKAIWTMKCSCTSTLILLSSLRVMKSFAVIKSWQERSTSFPINGLYFLPDQSVRRYHCSVIKYCQKARFRRSYSNHFKNFCPPCSSLLLKRLKISESSFSSLRIVCLMESFEQNHNDVVNFYDLGSNSIQTKIAHEL
jgi:hypothetical protein